ncbi:site-specific integrase [Synechococcus sp. BA-132 BA5]|uniref:site-specific integrase n=1 Tax=Synechococcus sp. BA-132 BA5 TaxID=3110252 RepID=UPI002B211522|nr:site-specific integrase [Synechococcus sp. BA-132 BA5]MEA5416932.1 site-specific integrase [Synechococcus sp. BA-132 BA5]
MAPTPGPRLLDRHREELMVRHYARRTISPYAQWVKRFLRFHGMRHSLAKVGQVSASTQNQALSALLFLYR